MTMNHPFYPIPVKLIMDMPTHLYYKGNLVKDSMGTAIVGSRRCSNYGKNLAIEYAQLLAAKIYLLSAEWQKESTPMHIQLA